MPEVVRANADSHIGHASPTPNPFHKTNYTNAAQGKVYAESNATSGHGSWGGNAAATGSSKVWAN